MTRTEIQNERRRRLDRMAREIATLEHQIEHETNDLRRVALQAQLENRMADRDEVLFRVQ